MPAKQIRLGDDWDHAIAAAASEKGVTEAAWLREAIRRALPAAVRAKLSVPRGPGQPRKVAQVVPQ